MPKHHVIIGSSAAGIAVMNKLATLEPAAHITCITEQQESPYNKCLLADYMAGSKSEQEVFLSTVLEKHSHIKCVRARATSINPEQKLISCENGATISYDTLFLGMGSSPFIPPFMNGKWYNGIFTFHTLADSNRILAFIQQQKVRKAIVIGAGLSGIECADVLQKKGIFVTIIERNARVLHQFLDENGSAFLQRRIEGNGAVLCDQTVTALYGSGQHIAGVQLASGMCIDADLLIIATGLRPNIQLAQTAGIATTSQGIRVNQFLQTNKTDIYAGGDIIAVMNLLTQKLMPSCTWPDAMAQGIHAAYAMAGQPRAYPGASIVTSSSFYDLHMAQAGILGSQDAKDRHIIKEGSTYHHQFLIREGRLKGFAVLGNAHNLGLLRRALLTGQPFTLE